MAQRKLFVNLPVKDLTKSVDFFTELGFEFNPEFTDENATCMILSDEASVMLLVEEFFATFTTKDVADAAASTGTILAISADSRAEVDQVVDAALAAGGGPSKEPMDEGFMYSRSFHDLDGHLWEVMYMDPSAVPG
jgi:predicted lactoylglutathione lyase